MPKRFTEITAPSAWASYLVNGDASGISDAERARADAWLERENVSVLGIADDEDGEPQEPRFTNWYRLHDPGAECCCGNVIDYTCRLLPKRRRK